MTGLLVLRRGKCKSQIYENTRIYENVCKLIEKLWLWMELTNDVAIADSSVRSENTSKCHFKGQLQTTHFVV